MTGVWDSRKDFTENISDIASVLGTWIRKVFGNIHKRKRELWARLGGIQKALAKCFKRCLLKLEEKLRRKLEEVLC